MFSNITSSFVSNAAATQGNTEFLLQEALIFPSNLLPPVTMYCIYFAFTLKTADKTICFLGFSSSALICSISDTESNILILLTDACKNLLKNIFPPILPGNPKKPIISNFLESKYSQNLL